MKKLFLFIPTLIIALLYFMHPASAEPNYLGAKPDNDMQPNTRQAYFDNRLAFKLAALAEAHERVLAYVAKSQDEQLRASKHNYLTETLAAQRISVLISTKITPLVSAAYKDPLLRWRSKAAILSA